MTGSRAFKFSPEDYALPAVISGFEAGDLLASVFKLTQMIADRQPALYNEYIRLVKDEGNPAAQAMIPQVFGPGDSVWRGLGSVAKSGCASAVLTPISTVPGALALPQRKPKRFPAAAVPRSSAVSSHPGNARCLKPHVHQRTPWGPAWFPQKAPVLQLINTVNERM